MGANAVVWMSKAEQLDEYENANAPPNQTATILLAGRFLNQSLLFGLWLFAIDASDWR